ncbi:MAG: hypothetical protein DRP42_05750 [Tenericutes bacterium]|nr:MAG: hypothetical protein DRP42_05750 [Mycoplasmatota bacterium]
MSTTTLTTEILREFRENTTTPVSVTSAEITQYLNWWYQDMCTFSKPIRNSATVTINPEQSIYALPNDCITVTEVWDGNDRLSPRTYNEKDDVEPRWRTSYADRANQYVPLGYNQIECYPRRTAAGTLTFHAYSQMPATLSAAQDPIIPLHHQRSAKKYVLGFLHAAKSRNIKLATKYMQEYQMQRGQFDASTSDGHIVDRQMAEIPFSRTKYNRMRKDR